jgi:hypothetical protein
VRARREAHRFVHVEQLEADDLVVGVGRLVDERASVFRSLRFSSVDRRCCRPTQMREADGGGWSYSRS